MLLFIIRVKQKLHGMGANKLKEILNTNVNNIEEFIMQYRTKNFIDLVYQTYPELRDKSNDLKEFEKSFYKMFPKLQKTKIRKTIS